MSSLRVQVSDFGKAEPSEDSGDVGPSFRFMSGQRSTVDRVGCGPKGQPGLHDWFG